MNAEDQNRQNIETNDPSHESPTSISLNSGSLGTAPIVKAFPKIPKPHGFCRPMFIVTGVALCMGLVSCVVPYDSAGGSSVSVTRYSPGYRVASLPGGYRSENISGRTYYYHEGYYYRPGSSGYVVVDAPRSSRYYDDYNRRQRTYQTSRVDRSSSSRYDNPNTRTEVITRLPDGYRKVNRRGKTYYQVGDRYYRRDNDGYVIVSRPY